MPKATAQTKTKTAAGAKPKRRAEQAPADTKEAGPRRLALPRRIWYKPLTWRHRPPVPARRPLSKARVLLWRTFKQLWTHKKLFGGIVGIYTLLTIVLVRGLAADNSLTDLKSALAGNGSKLVTSLAGFFTLLAGSGTGASAAAGVYQYVLITVFGLAIIWALRQIAAGSRVRVRDSFYRGMYPLAPFVLTQLIMGLQLLPLVVAGTLYNLMIGGGIAVHAWEQAAVYAVIVLLALWSLRMLGSSLFGAFIATLPDMTPLKALRNARQVVYGRRLQIWRKLIFLPVALVVIAAVIELPLIWFVTPAASWVFFALTMLVLPVIYGYLYNLYREML